MTRAGRVARIVLAPIIAYAALLVATSLALVLIEALRGDLSAFHPNLVLSVSGLGRLFRQVSPTGVAISQIVGEGGALSAVALWLRRQIALREILDRRPRPADLGLGLLGTGAILVLAGIIGAILLALHATEGSPVQQAFARGIGSPWLLLLMALVAGFAEEATFRGYILRSFMRLSPLWLAIVLESAVFAVFHLGWGLAFGPFVAIFTIGVGLSLIALRSHIYVAMVAHAGYDALALLIALHAH